MGTGQKPGKKPASDYILDRLLVPRVEQYSVNHSIVDADKVVHYLRRNYREYQRKPQAAFIREVEKAIRKVKARARAEDEEEEEDSPDSSEQTGEARLQEPEHRHLARRAMGLPDGGRKDADESEQAGSGSLDARSSREENGWAPVSGKDSGNRRKATRKRVQERSDSEVESSDSELVVHRGSSDMLNSSLRTAYGQPSILQQSPTCPPGQQGPAPGKVMRISKASLQKVAGSSGVAERMAQVGGKRERSETGTPVPTKVAKLTHDAGKTSRNGVSMSAPKNISFEDLGGIEGVLNTITKHIVRPLRHPELYKHLGLQPPRGVLLHGPPGCGKTSLANAIAVEMGVPFFKISAPEVVSGMSGESEAKVRVLFADAERAAPSIIFIDEIDAIAQKRETAQKGMESRIVAQLLTCMDDLNQPPAVDASEDNAGPPSKQTGHVIVIGATNRPEVIDPALRRAGRFDREIALGIPDERARGCIIAALTRNLRLEGTLDFMQIARQTPGFVGADLAALTQEAAAIALDRIFDTSQMSSNVSVQAQGTGSVEKASISRVGEGLNQLQQGSWHLRTGPFSEEEMQDFCITMQDFKDAIATAQPSAKREGFSTLPDVTWEDVGSLGDVRKELQFTISGPIKHPEYYKALGLDKAMGVLLYGPPGCGKTLVAKASANDAGANFICIKGPELLNKYVGESERAVRSLFVRARASAPCILFFDEMDAIAPKRGGGENHAAERVVNQLLTEMDGLEQRKSVFIIAATNRPDMIDPALLRPGRLDKLLYIPLPDREGRASILRTLCRGRPVAADVDIHSLAVRCEGFSGADLGALVREAKAVVLRESISAMTAGEVPLVGSCPALFERHFVEACTRIFPSVSSKDRLRYELLRTSLGRSRAHLPESDS